MKRFLKELTAVVLVSLFFCAQSFAYTDLLPIGAASDTIAVSNGSGWTLQQLPASWTLNRGSLIGSTGAGLSLAGGTAFLNAGNYASYVSTNVISFNATLAPSTFTAQTGIGGSTLSSAWYTSPGKTIQIIGKGLYSTNATATNWTWGISIGTYPLCSATGVALANQTNQYWTENALVTLATVGTSTSTWLCSIDVTLSSTSLATPVMISSSTPSPILNIPIGGAFNPTFTWSVVGSSLQANSYVVEQMN
jgi:hypothetical protein